LIGVAVLKFVEIRFECRHNDWESFSAGHEEMIETIGPLPLGLANVLAQKLRDGQLVLFVGAGLSMQAIARDGSGDRMPSWHALLSQIAEQFGESPTDYSDEPLGLLDAIVESHSRHDLEEAVRTLIADTNFAPSSTHHDLAALPWATVCTTNYDTLLERCLNAESIFNESGHDLRRRSANRKPILYKLHGALSELHTLTAQDYKLWPTRHPRTYEFVKGLLLDKSVLFVGYGLNDPHWKILLDLVQEILGSRTRSLYAWIWQATDKRLQSLQRLYQINAISLESSEDYARAFKQLASAVVMGTSAIHDARSELDLFVDDRTRYVEAIRSTFGFANLQGLYRWGAGFARDDVPLANVFVPPDLQLRKPRFGPPQELPGSGLKVVGSSELQKERERLAKLALADDESRDPAATVFANRDKVLIVGPPGQGKSTLLHDWLLRSAQQWRAAPATAPFPFFVRLSDWAWESGPAEGRLMRYLAQRLPGFAQIRESAADAWRTGSILWMLDGIDEIRGSKARQEFQEDLIRLCGQRPQDRFIVTTRPAGEPLGGLGTGWARAELPGLSDGQILAALHNWAAVLHRKDGVTLDSNDMAWRLRNNPGLRQVRINALLLTMAVLFYKHSKRLPHDRWEFYDGAEKALRDAWARYRLSTREIDSLPGDYAGVVLEYLALNGLQSGQLLFSANEIETAARSELARRGYAGRDLERESQRFLEAARDLIGVLVEQAPDRFGFVHLTFQEFLAARALVKRGRDASKIIARFWDHPDWIETWTLYSLGCQDHQDRFSEMFRVILDPGNRHTLDDWLHRPEEMSLRLAGLGNTQLPPEAQPALRWAEEAICRGSRYELFIILRILGDWERALPPQLHRDLLALFTDRDDWVRWWVIKCVGSRTDDSAIRSAVMSALADVNSAVCGAAAEALAASASSPDVRDALLDASMRTSPPAVFRWDESTARSAIAAALSTIARQDPKVRGALLAALDIQSAGDSVVKALASIADDSAIRDLLVVALRGGDSLIRSRAAKALVKVAGQPIVRNALLTALGDTSDSVRTATAEALAKVSVEPSVRDALLATVANNQHPGRSDAVMALANSAANPIVRDALVAAMGDFDSSVRAAAAKALAPFVSDPSVRQRLLITLWDLDQDVCVNAAKALATVADDPKVRDAILTLLHRSRVKLLSRTAAVKALGKAIGEPRVRDVLLALNDDELGSIRDAAMEAMVGGVNNKAVRRALLAGLADVSGSVRETAVVALSGSVSVPGVRRALVRALSDERWVIRQKSANALAPVATKPAVTAALLTALKDVDEDVREAAAQSLCSGLTVEKFALHFRDATTYRLGQ